MVLLHMFLKVTKIVRELLIHFAIEEYSYGCTLQYPDFVSSVLITEPYSLPDFISFVLITAPDFVMGQI